MKLFVFLCNWEHASATDTSAMLLGSIRSSKQLDASYLLWFLNRFPVSMSIDLSVTLQLLAALINASSQSNMLFAMNALLQSFILFTLRMLQHDRLKGRKGTRDDDSSPRSRPRSLSSSSEQEYNDGILSDQKLYLLCETFIGGMASSKECMFALFWALVYETDTNSFYYSDRKQVGNAMYKWMLDQIKQYESVLCHFCGEGILLMNLLVRDVLHCVKTVNSQSDSLQKKTDEFKAMLRVKAEAYFQKSTGRLLLSPLDADLKLVHVLMDSCKLFASNRAPALVTFQAVPVKGGADRVTTSIIFKYGDDLRMDQLALLLLDTANAILLSVGVDSRIELYKVIPTSAMEGLVQFIDGVPLSSLSKTHNGSILEYLQEHNFDGREALLISRDALRNYTCTCAFYCVLSFVLGIGDRHLDNILLSSDGCLVHIDFAFLFGEDPKHSSSLMRLSQAMVDAMGGENGGTEFEDFQRICCLTYNALRKFHDRLTSTIASYVESGLACVKGRNNRKAVLFVEERLRLQLTGKFVESRITSDINMILMVQRRKLRFIYARLFRNRSIHIYRISSKLRTQYPYRRSRQLVLVATTRTRKKERSSDGRGLNVYTLLRSPL